MLTVRISGLKTLCFTSAIMLRPVDGTPSSYHVRKTFCNYPQKTFTDKPTASKNVLLTHSSLDGCGIPFFHKHRKNYRHNQDRFSRKETPTLNRLSVMSVFVGAGIGVKKTEEDDEILENIDKEINLVSNGGSRFPENLHTHLTKQGWEKTLDTKRTIVWRRLLNENDASQHEFKMYCRFDDVSARAFLLSQVDIDFRKHWDDKVISLDVIETYQNDESEVLRWVSKFPWPFTAREYIFWRRCQIDANKRRFILSQQCVEHPHFTQRDSSLVRVDSFRSHCVIMTRSTLDQKGCEIFFTYTDNPKINLTNKLTNWGTNHAFPSFVEQMHSAAVRYQEDHGDRIEAHRQKYATT